MEFEKERENRKSSVPSFQYQGNCSYEEEANSKNELEVGQHPIFPLPYKIKFCPDWSYQVVQINFTNLLNQLWKYS